MRKRTILLFSGALALVACGGKQLKTKGPEVSPPRPQAQPVAQLSPTDARVQQILDTAAFYFDRGNAEYQSGHLEKARRDFDTCIDTFLLSGMNPESEPRLASALDGYLAEIQTRELEAFEEGDGFTEVPLEPAPIDELEEAVPEPPQDAESSDLIEKIEEEISETDYDIPVVVNDKVLAFISVWQHRRRYEIEGGLRRSGRFIGLVRNILKEEGLPQDLAYMALIESSFKTHAYSRAKAMGMWQFISATGKRYDLKQDWWVDERRDFEKATHGAAGYLRDLYAMFGDWYLAMAAYNAGERTIEYAIKKTGKTSFWELAQTRYLRTETKNYVPAILAGMLIAKNQEKYGFDVPADDPVEFETAEIPTTTDLRLVAECADTTLEQIQDLNPELRRLTTPKGVANYPLRVPKGTGETFTANFARIPSDKRVTWRLHTVRPGDTLTKIASQFGTSVSSVLQVNSLQESDIQVGSKIIIPMGPKLIAQATAPAVSSYRSVSSAPGGQYTVRRGDTLYGIARRFGLSTSVLMQRNGLGSTALRPGDKLVVRWSTTSAPSKSQSYEKIVYLVKSGDTLYNIANNYDTTVDSIRSANGLSRSRLIHPGDRLTIYRGKK